MSEIAKCVWRIDPMELVLRREWAAGIVERAVREHLALCIEKIMNDGAHDIDAVSFVATKRQTHDERHNIELSVRAYDSEHDVMGLESFFQHMGSDTKVMRIDQDTITEVRRQLQIVTVHHWYVEPELIDTP